MGDGATTWKTAWRIPYGILFNNDKGGNLAILDNIDIPYNGHCAKWEVSQSEKEKCSLGRRTALLFNLYDVSKVKFEISEIETLLKCTIQYVNNIF